MHILTEMGAVVTTREVTWANVPVPSTPSPVQPKCPTPAESEEAANVEYVYLPASTALQEAGREVAMSSPPTAASSPLTSVHRFPHLQRRSPQQLRRLPRQLRLLPRQRRRLPRQLYRLQVRKKESTMERFLGKVTLPPP